jgi:hypothetical protein
MFKMQRINLLKFLYDEMLNTALIREHIDQCADKLNDLHQTFGMLYPWLFLYISAYFTFYVKHI